MGQIFKGILTNIIYIYFFEFTEIFIAALLDFSIETVPPAEGPE